MSSIVSQQPMPPVEEKMQSITASPPFAQHSFEVGLAPSDMTRLSMLDSRGGQELRLAYLRAGRPMASPEIFRMGWNAVA